MPAAAVIRRPQALSGITGRKASVGGFLSLSVKLQGSTLNCGGNWETRVWEGQAER